MSPLAAAMDASTAPTKTANGLVVEEVQFTPAFTSPVSSRKLLLIGAGVRGIQINPQLFLKVTCLGFYVDPQLLELISNKWGNKSSEELREEDEFYADIVTAPFEKVARVTMLKPLPGVEFASKVMEHTKQELGGEQALGEEESKAVERFQELCRDRSLPVGGGPIFVVTQAGLAVGFSDGSDAELSFSEVFGSAAFAQAILGTMIGKHSVSPAAKASIADTIATN